MLRLRLSRKLFFCPRNRNVRFYFFVITIFAIVLTATYFYILHLWTKFDLYYNPADAAFNYFEEVEQYSKLGYIINTPNCQIANISAWDKAVLPHLLKLPPVECRQGHPLGWTYVNETNLVINSTALIASGYSPDSVSCCFKTILRVEQSVQNYDVHADEVFLYSDLCKPMGPVTKMDAKEEFVKVFCTSKYWPFYSNVVYKDYHAIALPYKTKETLAKTETWKSRRRSSSRSRSPPNVLVLGIDSLSRLSFQRHMGRLRTHLQNIGAIELKGYTKVGENTFPNTVAFLTGYYEEDLELFCYLNRWKHQDGCPYIWKRFGGNGADYWTAMAEDVPHVTAFNFWKTGFIARPVDFYLRPYMLAVYTAFFKPLQQLVTRCIGEDPVARRLMKYVTDLLSLSTQEETPIFIHGWTNVAHDDFNAAQLVDDIFADFFQTTDLNNTFIFFLSDHGYRFGSFRPTFPGWIEDKLPNSWVYVPPEYREEHPKWYDAVIANSERLTTPFDVYHTMNHIIDTYIENPPKLVDSQNSTGTIIPRRFGQSLFNPIQDSRTCEEAGVPINYCACVVPKQVRVDDPLVKSAVETAVAHLNSLLPSQCARTKLKSITASAILVKTTEPPNPNDKGKQWRIYIIAFITLPGDFVFEANVDYIYGNGSDNNLGKFNATTNSQGSFRISTDILRMNKMTTDYSCVSDGFLQRICFCK